MWTAINEEIVEFSHPNKACLKSKTLQRVSDYQEKEPGSTPDYTIDNHLWGLWVAPSFLMTQFSPLITKDNLIAPLLALMTHVFNLWTGTVQLFSNRCSVSGLPDQTINFSRGISNLLSFSFISHPTHTPLVCNFSGSSDSMNNKNKPY